jgi:hypothetical protein
MLCVCQKLFPRYLMGIVFEGLNPLSVVPILGLLSYFPQMFILLPFSNSSHSMRTLFISKWQDIFLPNILYGIQAILTLSVSVSLAVSADYMIRTCGVILLFSSEIIIHKSPLRHPIQRVYLPLLLCGSLLYAFNIPSGGISIISVALASANELLRFFSKAINVASSKNNKFEGVDAITQVLIQAYLGTIFCFFLSLSSDSLLLCQMVFHSPYNIMLLVILISINMGCRSPFSVFFRHSRVVSS